MHKIAGFLFAVFVALAAVFAFSARHGPPMPATGVAIGNVLLLDAAHAGRRLVAVGERGTIFVSDDRAASWRHVASGTETTLTAVAFADDRLGLAVGHDALILRSEDGGLSWRKVHDAPKQLRPLLDVAFVAPGRAIAIGAYGAFLESTDGGLSWTAQQIVAEDVHLNALARLSDGSLLVAGEAGTLLRRSSDGGAQWEKLPSPYGGSFFGLLPLEGGTVLAYGMRGKVLRSEDRGSSWQVLAVNGVDSIFGGLLQADGRVLLLGQNGTVLESRDQGRSFVRLSGNGSRVLNAALSLPGGREVWAFGEGGVVRLGNGTGSVAK